MGLFRQHLHPDDLDTDEENDETIDPELRLRTVRTAASTIAESFRDEQRVQRRRSRLRQRSLKLFRGKSKEKRKAESSETDSAVTEDGKPPVQPVGKRRNIYVNSTLPPSECDANGEPLARYVRNKVRTTKYTILSFIPKNLYEQFRRVANLYFLALVLIQVFPVFGAAAAQISMLPLVFILAVTAIKDGVEDYRRAITDEEVNTSSATKLGDWRNVNQPKDPRPWYEKALGLNPPGKVTKGVRKLREREADTWGRIVLQRNGEMGDAMSDSDRTAAAHDQGPDASSVTLGKASAYSQIGDPSDYSLSYPPVPPLPGYATRASSSSLSKRPRSDSLGQVSGEAMSTRSQTQKVLGVIDWNRRTPGTARWERTLWKKLEVGDIVLLRDNDQVPADIVVLSTSEEDGLCYLETKNLDGETNLKPRRSLKATSSLQSEEDIEHASFVLDSEPPHANLYLFNGVLRYQDRHAREEKAEPVTINELLLRGCSVRNTNWIIGLVVFTGADTKIMLNGGNTPSKRSKIERETNFNVVVNFIVLILMCLATGIANGVLDAKTNTSKAFFEADSEPSSSHIINGIVTFASCLIVFQNIVPISLYISIEIVKTIQAFFISQDIDMFYAPYDTACVPKTWNISDDLGQIEYIFSDKTGTLTQNIMEFQKCSVNGVPYGEGITEAQRGSAMRTGNAVVTPEEQTEQLAALKQDMLQKMSRGFTNHWQQADKLTLISPKLALELSDRSSPQHEHLIAFFRALALCHSVIADRPDPQMQPYHVDYKAESPDEAALVAATRDAGFPFVGKANGFLEIEVMGRPERFALLKLLEFNSTRKRMSVIVRSVEGRIILYTKGADSVIYARLAADQDQELKVKTQKDMEDFANGGLRTLCIAYRILSEEEYTEWARIYDAAASAVNDREELIEQACEKIEHSLYILGATALEDKLQEGVPDAIEMLHRAGIKLWILTGDKVQTAIEIGYSCNLLKQDMDVMIVTAASKDEARTKIEAGLNKIASVLGPPRWTSESRGFIPGAQASFGIVIDGDTLRYALEPDLKPMFLNLATQCETVVCCRVSPAQKALTVKLVKEGRNAMTLSIGDGANDVAMIQEANVGCGLLGLEGSQAAMSADYAFGQFRFLTKLLIVHGRWSYLRVADMHANFFYKNVIWTLAMFWYLPFNSFDATYLYQYTFILLYNIVFSSLPVISMGAFDQDINAKAALAFPQLYLRGIRGLDYTRLKFWLYMGDGLYQSVVVFFIPYFAWSLGPAVAWNGKGIDSLADFGTTIAVAAIISVNCYVGMNTRYWTVITWIVVIGSSLVMIIWIIIYSFFESVDFNNEVVVLFGEVTFWVTVLLTVVTALAPRYVVKAVRSCFFPLDRDIVREMWVRGDLKKRLGIKRRKDPETGDTNRGFETTPIRAYHDRSISTGSQYEIGYEPAYANSPGEFEMTPPQTVGIANRARQEEDWQQGPQYVVAGDPDEANYLAPGAHASPGAGSVSPHPSYYSASDIPPPSPLPEPQYLCYNPEPTMISRVTTPVSAHTPPPKNNLELPYQPPLRNEPTARGGGIETRVRSPPSAFPARMQSTSPFPRAPSQASEYSSDPRAASRAASEHSRYATASEGWDDEDDASTINEHTHGRPGSTYSTSPHAL
ncbi:phospholipid-translocating P-type ATPase [Fomitiporia mediterranea MF3/22]|uniref:phospholipid-translocating P-type ATPase n=1 Tax=Fomitiporia mediterranea (strain MF3/22) TaxID=694068 RepID=UPI000440897B|nr:phospholipid-translocating P-type ATPase [Fomitiporia mediterranea MF3/22]EJD08500.1 phospholipid-translocating P-type ATPase [Fomitiporia mediterranea MF3/22]